MKRRKWIWRGLAVGVGVLVAGVILVRSVARADTPASINIVLPSSVEVTLNQSKIIFVGRSSGATTVACQEGSFTLQSSVIVGNIGVCGTGFVRYAANLD